LQIKLAASSLEKISPACRGNSSASANRRFEFHKRGQQFIRVHNVTFAFIAMRVCNPDRSPVGINPDKKASRLD